MNAISIAATFKARCNPSPAPTAAASITFDAFFSTLIFTFPFVNKR